MMISYVPFFPLPRLLHTFHVHSFPFYQKKLQSIKRSPESHLSHTLGISCSIRLATLIFRCNLHTTTNLKDCYSCIPK